MGIILYMEREDAEGVFCDEIELPTKREVCPRCDGSGRHDAWEGGMTSDEMDEQGDDFREDYMAGVYMVPCSECHGRNVIDVVDEDRLSPEQLKAWHDQLEDEHNYRAECAAERRMGA